MKCGYGEILIDITSNEELQIGIKESRTILNTITKRKGNWWEGDYDERKRNINDYLWRTVEGRREEKGIKTEGYKRTKKRVWIRRHLLRMKPATNYIINCCKTVLCDCQGHTVVANNSPGNLDIMGIIKVFNRTSQ